MVCGWAKETHQMTGPRWEIQREIKPMSEVLAGNAGTRRDCLVGPEFLWG